MLLLIFLWKNFKVLYRVSHLWKWLKVWCGDWIIIVAVSLVVKKPVQLPNYDTKTKQVNFAELKYSNRTVTTWYKKCMKSQERNCQGSHHGLSHFRSQFCVYCVYSICAATSNCATLRYYSKGFIFVSEKKIKLYCTLE